MRAWSKLFDGSDAPCKHFFMHCKAGANRDQVVESARAGGRPHLRTLLGTSMQILARARICTPRKQSPSSAPQDAAGFISRGRSKHSVAQNHNTQSSCTGMHASSQPCPSQPWVPSHRLLPSPPRSYNAALTAIRGNEEMWVKLNSSLVQDAKLKKVWQGTCTSCWGAAAVPHALALRLLLWYIAQASLADTSE